MRARHAQRDVIVPRPPAAAAPAPALPAYPPPPSPPPPRPRPSAVACGSDFSLALDGSGRVFACGTQQDGVCGTGKTGEYIASAGKIAFAPVARFKQVPMPGYRITDIATGAAHSLALEADGQVFSWGAGGYGRCGHGDNKDALAPRLIRTFDPERMRVATIGTGASSSFFVTRLGHMLYMAGITKKSGEANMAPKPVYDLQGWHVRAITSGASSTLCAADASLVVWGPSPTSGELGIGEAKKSSTTPVAVEEFKDVRVLAVAAGLASSYIVVDATSETPEGAKARAMIEGGRWPTYDPAADAAIAAGHAAAAGKKRAADAAAAATGSKKAKKA